MEIAVCIDGNRLVIAQAEGDTGVIAGLECLALAAMLRLNIDPLNEVFGSHGMVHGTYIDVDSTVFHRDHRQMLFTAGLHSDHRPLLAFTVWAP